MRRFLLRLYPAVWRTRYGDEFDALLEERPLTPFDVADVLLGAVDAHIHPRGRVVSKSRKGLTMSRHLGGSAAIMAGCLWLVGAAMGNLPSSDIAMVFPDVMMFAGVGMLLPALAGLSSSQARRRPLLIWAAFGIPAGGVVAYCFGAILGAVLGEQSLYNAVVPPLLTFGYGATVAGSALFAAVTYRTGVLPGRGVALLGIGSGLLTVAIAFFAIPVPGIWHFGKMIGEISFLAVPLGWIVLGWSEVQLDRRVAIEATPNREDGTRSLQAGGAAAVLGGSLCVAGWMVHERSDSYSVFLIVAGMGALIVALAGLSSFRLWLHPILSSAAFSIPAFGIVLSVVTSLYSQWLVVQPLDHWVSVPSVLGSVTLYGGTALFAALTYRTGMLSRRAPWMLAIGSALVLGGRVYYDVAAEGALGMSFLYPVGFLLVAFGWIALGWSAVRLAHRVAATTWPAAA